MWDFAASMDNVQDVHICPSNSLYFMEIATSISIWLQQTNSSSKLLENFSKSILFFNFQLPLRIFQNKFESSSLINQHHFLEHYEAWRDKEPIWIKTEVLLPKKCKISFLPCLLGYFTIFQQLHCKIYVWRCCGAKLIFVLIISI